MVHRRVWAYLGKPRLRGSGRSQQASLTRTGTVAVVVLLSCLLLASYSLPAQAQLPLDVFRVYSYQQMAADVETLVEAYPDAIQQVDIIGHSVYGRPLWAVKLGQGDASILINGSHHAREWISTSVIMKMLEAYARAYQRGEAYRGYDVRNLLDQVSIWFIPMVNPDGVELQQRGLSSFPAEAHASLVAMNEGSRDFRRWKANARGVDLNRQYPVRWEAVVGCPGRPSYSHYRGPEPLSEPENLAMVAFTREVLPWMAVSYHSSGRVIFYPSHSPHQAIAQALAGITGYRPFPLTLPAAGYTDWFVETFNRPAYTPELSYAVGPTNPPLSVFPGEWERNREVGLYLAQRSLDLYGSRADAARSPREGAPGWAPGYAHYVFHNGQLQVPLGLWAGAHGAELRWQPDAGVLSITHRGRTAEVSSPAGFRPAEGNEPLWVDPDRLPADVLIEAGVLALLMAGPPPAPDAAPEADEPAADEQPGPEGAGTPPPDQPEEAAPPGTEDQVPALPDLDRGFWAQTRRLELTVGSDTVHADGMPVRSDAAPFIERGRTYVPVRLVAEAFLAQADWEPKDAPVERVILEADGLRIALDIGQPRLLVTREGLEQVQEFDGSPRIRNGRTFLPFRALAEAFGEQVDYATDAEGLVSRVWFTRGAIEPAP